MDKRPIGMFDSGMGGITVLKELKKVLPNEQFIYLGDTKRFPYGSKSKETIVEISKKCVDFLISKDVKVIIIACGTATSQALEFLKKSCSVPIIGIIEPTIDYICDNLNNNCETIGIIATSGTIKSGEWERKLKQRVKTLNIINTEAPLLATMAEQGWTNNKVAEYTIREYMYNFSNIDKLVLGCTHYPLFAELIRKELKDSVEIINTGVLVAKYLKEFVVRNDLENDILKKDFEINITDSNEVLINIVSDFLEEDVTGKVFLVDC